jgi:hypothetical protein
MYAAGVVYEPGQNLRNWGGKNFRNPHRAVDAGLGPARDDLRRRGAAEDTGGG